MEQENLNTTYEEDKPAKTWFPSVKGGHIVIADIPEDYTQYKLSSFDNLETYKGKPTFTAPEEINFVDEDTGEEVTKYRCKFYVVNSARESAMEANINLKTKEDLQKNIRVGSVLYDFIGSLIEFENPNFMEKNNIITQVDLSEIREFVNQLNSIEIEIHEHNGNFSYNTFKVTKCEM